LRIGGNARGGAMAGAGALIEVDVVAAPGAAVGAVADGAAVDGAVVGE
jgi:hypothetical protein